MNMLQNKKFLVFVSVCLLLLLGLVLVLNSYSAKNQAKREELEGIYESLYEQAMIEIEQNEIKRDQEKRERAIKEATYSPYEKLNDETMLACLCLLSRRP